MTMCNCSNVPNPGQCCNCVCNFGLQGPPGPAGTISTSPVIMENFVINQADVTTTDAIVPATSNLRGWIYTTGQVNTSLNKILLDGTGTIFTVVEPGVYYITSSISLFPGDAALSGQVIVPQIYSRDYYQGSFILYFNNSDGSPYLDAGRGIYSGYTKLPYESACLVLNYAVYLPNPNMQFYIYNSTPSPVKLLNGFTSGSAANLTIFKIGASVLN